MTADTASRSALQPSREGGEEGPRHALSFDLEAVHVMEREGGQWSWRGAARYDSADMAGRLANLRRGLDVSEDRAAVALIIPDDQVLFTDLTVDPALPRREAVAKGLDGLTPYKVDELDFDWVDRGPDKVRVAAVWRETLSEASAFATSHGFIPVAAVADPDGTQLDREVQFGRPEAGEVEARTEADDAGTQAPALDPDAPALDADAPALDAEAQRGEDELPLGEVGAREPEVPPATEATDAVAPEAEPAPAEAGATGAETEQAAQQDSAPEAEALASGVDDHAVEAGVAPGDVENEKPEVAASADTLDSPVQGPAQVGSDAIGPAADDIEAEAPVRVREDALAQAIERIRALSISGAAAGVNAPQALPGEADGVIATVPPSDVSAEAVPTEVAVPAGSTDGNDDIVPEKSPVSLSDGSEMSSTGPAAAEGVAAGDTPTEPGLTTDKQLPASDDEYGEKRESSPASQRARVGGRLAAPPREVSFAPKGMRDRIAPMVGMGLARARSGVALARAGVDQARQRLGQLPPQPQADKAGPPRQGAQPTLSEAVIALSAARTAVARAISGEARAPVVVTAVTREDGAIPAATGPQPATGREEIAPIPVPSPDASATERPAAPAAAAAGAAVVAGAALARDPRARVFHERAASARLAAGEGAARGAQRPARTAARRIGSDRGFYVMLALLAVGLLSALIFGPGWGVQQQQQQSAAVPAPVETAALDPAAAPPEAEAPADDPAPADPAPADAVGPLGATDTAPPVDAPSPQAPGAQPAQVAPAPEAAPAPAATMLPTPSSAGPAPVASAPSAAPAPAPATVPAAGPASAPPAAAAAPTPPAAPAAPAQTTAAAPARAAAPAPAHRPSAPAAAPAARAPAAAPAPTARAAEQRTPEPTRQQAIDAAVADAVRGEAATPVRAVRPVRAPEGREAPAAPARPAAADASPEAPRDPLPYARASEPEPTPVTGRRPPDRPADRPSAPAPAAAPEPAPAADAGQPAPRPTAPPQRQGALGTPQSAMRFAASGGPDMWGRASLAAAFAAMPDVPRGAVQLGRANDRALSRLEARGPRFAQSRPPQRETDAPVVPRRRATPAAPEAETASDAPAARPAQAAPAKPSASAVDAALAEAAASAPAASAPAASGGASSARPARRAAAAAPASGGAAPTVSGSAVDSAIKAAIEDSPATPGGVALTALQSSPFPERAPRGRRAADTAGATAAAAATAAAPAARAAAAEPAPIETASAADDAARTERLRLDEELQRQAEERIRARAAADAKVEQQQRAQAEARARAQAEAEARANAARGQPAYASESDNEPEIAGPVGGGTTAAGVAANATVGGLDLRRTTLIGVIGAGPASRGLIRLRNGKIVTVRLGDKINGGPITGIENSALTYVKGGRPYQLRMLDGR